MQGKSHMINIIVSIAQQSQGFVHMTRTPLGRRCPRGQEHKTQQVSAQHSAFCSCSLSLDDSSTAGSSILGRQICGVVLSHLAP